MRSVRATLVHNPAAGADDGPEVDEIVRAVEALGARVRVVAPDDLEQGGLDGAELVVVAGGDGTVGRVAKCLAGTKTPLAVVPTGTANNVARSLGVGTDVRAALDELRLAAPHAVDLGWIGVPDGDSALFLEGIGVGIFASLLGERVTKKHKNLDVAADLIAHALETYAPHQIELEIDGHRVSGDYLLASVLNLRSVGPALVLAPDARFDDGLLDVALVRPHHRDALLGHLKRGGPGAEEPAPLFEIHRGASLRLRTDAKWLHVDDKAWEVAGDVSLSVRRGVVTFLVPQRPIPPR
jgi:diacylglycerol kinase family enzyme